MNIGIHHISKILMLAMLIASAQFASARTEMIKSADMLSSNAGKEGSDISALLDNDASTIWQTKTDPGQTEAQYIQIDFGEVISLDPETEDLVIRVQRHDGSQDLGKTKHPTVFRVMVSGDGEAWEPFADPSTHVYFLSRGLKTTEYSTRITTNKSFQYMRLVLTANNSRTVVPNSTDNTSETEDKAIRCMAVGGLQIIRLGRNENYSENLIDRFRLTTDYIDCYKSWTFENTQGILDSRNTVNELFDWEYYKSFPYWQDGKWTKDTEKLKEWGIEMPDYSFLTSETDTDLAPGQKRQPTHVVEHDLYAMPGDAIALYPYYDLYTESRYYEHFVHWYDYTTGGRLQISETGTDLLDFLIDPAQLFRSDNFGYVASEGSLYYYDPGTEVVKKHFVINSAEEWNEAAKYIKNNASSYNKFYSPYVELNNDIDFTETGGKLVPIGLANSWDKTSSFFGVFNGNLHTISNVNKIVDANDSEVTTCIFEYVGRDNTDVVIANLIIDENCKLEGLGSAGIINEINGKKTNVIIKNIINNADVKANNNWNNMYASGIVTRIDVDESSSVIIDNCGFTGKSEYDEVASDKEKISAAFIAKISGSPNVTISNSWTSVISEENNYLMYGGDITLDNDHFFNNYSKSGVQGSIKLPEGNINTADFVSKLGNGWMISPDVNATTPTINDNPENTKVPDESKYEPEQPDKSKWKLFTGDRKYGRVATFFYPRNPYFEGGKAYNLPFDNDRKEYIIAADFSHNFGSDRNILFENSVIAEPIINFRHIFRIRDGKAQADSLSGSKELNDAYVKKHQRFISARAGVPFQVRLDSPVPVDKTTRSKYYYKISDTDYRRICTSIIKVYDAKTGEEIKNHGFDFDEKGNSIFQGQGVRSINDVDYYICGGGGSYYRMLACDANNAKEGTYVVKLIGKGYGGIDIHPYGAPKEDLVVQQFCITFMPEESAYMVTENELNTIEKYAHGRVDNLIKKYGKPRIVVDFDEYANLVGDSDNLYVKSGSTQVENQTVHMFKWPVPWDKSNYSFTYYYLPGGNAVDFNTYGLMENSAMGSKKAYNMFDRLYHDTNGEKKGFMFYVNAASDPGIMAVLPIDKMCAGSAIHVSAWIAETNNQAERANVSFNLVARMKDQNGFNKDERVLLHSFITGYVSSENTGQWMKVYYTLQPNFSDFSVSIDDIDRFEIELDNNCKSSNGADYVVDNIQAFVTQPISYAKQKEPLCSDENVTETLVEVDVPFDIVLQALDVKAASDASEGKTGYLYYTFLDNELYENARKQGKEKKEAVEASRLVFDYNGDGDDGQTYGRLEFNTYYESNPEYDKTNNTVNTAFRAEIDGIRAIVFNSMPKDKNGLKVGKEYLVAFAYRSKEDLDNVDTFNDITDFELDGDCAKTSLFSVVGAASVKVDGVIVPDMSAMSVCEGNSPTVQVDIYGKHSNSEKLEIYEENACVDWYAGPIDEYNDDTELIEALTKFREEYPESETADVEPKGGFTDAMRARLLSLTVPTDEMPQPKLLLYRRSFLFPPVKWDEQEDAKAYCNVVAIPIDADTKGEDWILCLSPVEVKMLIEKHDPALKHGFDIDYPGRITDVPLRIGLRQILSVSAADNSYDQAKSLYVPIREVSGGNMRVRDDNDIELMLVDTNDPEYEDLSLKLVDTDAGLIPVGWLRGMTAEAEGAGNHFMVSFDEGFDFKEGCYYTFRFQFEEDSYGGSAETCSGQHVFTIKVVPEYQQWTGGASLNWNNDDNWQRVASGDLYRDKADESDRYVTDGSNGLARSYAPLDFTKVIVPHGETCPHLYNKMLSDISVFDGKGNKSYKWTADLAADAADSQAGAPTADIQYDMAAVTYDDGDIACRPWYMNTCEQINFRPGAEIMNQQHLIYGKAWVEMEIACGRWHTLAAPLQSMVAGDMYLPTKGGRQLTPLFEPITYSTDLNDRFRPAVYQRSWNKAFAWVTEIDDKTHNVAVVTTWSNVFNDVAETYDVATGNGYSIKPDVTDMPGDKPDKVLFRFPKADESYYYYNKDFGDSSSSNNISGDNTPITRANPYKLNATNGTMTVAAAAESKYFLVGNPFMAHMDMRKFLEANSDKVQMKYWIVSAGKNAAIEYSESGEVTATTDVVGNVAPMQGFFVEAKDATSELELKYDESMMCVPASEDGAELHSMGSRAGSDGQSLAIDAMSAAGCSSRAIVLIDESASPAYDENEDMLLMADKEMMDAPLVYTLAGNVATSINRLDRLERVEVGVIAKAGEDVTLRFADNTISDRLMLYDALTGEYTRIDEGMEYGVTGAATGRLYITEHETDDELESMLKVILSGRAVTVKSANDGVSVRIYDNVSGIMLRSEQRAGNEVTVDLDPGLYIVVAEDGVEKSTKKILVR